MDEVVMDFRTLADLWYEQNTIGLGYIYTNSLRSFINHANTYFGSKDITEVSPLDISKLITTMAKKNPHTKRPTSKSTLEELSHTLKRIFEMAVDNDWINKNPAKNAKKFIPKNAPKKEVGAISKEEQLAIINTPHRFQTAAMIMMLTGLRRGEIIALLWNDVDLENKLIFVHRHASEIGANSFSIGEGTKNGRNRYVNIPDSLCEFLKEKNNEAISPYVFPQKNGNPQTPSSWKSAWNSYINELNFAAYCKKDPLASKFDPKGYPKTIHINSHQLRHTYATLLYLSGTDVVTASKLMGHSSVQMTVDIYTDLDEKFKQYDISNFNNYLADELCKDFCNNSDVDDKSNKK